MNKKYKYPEYRKKWNSENKDKIRQYVIKHRPKKLMYLKSYYIKNKERICFLEKARRLKQKIKCFEYYCGGLPFCVCCGEKETMFLSIDHINGGGGKQKKELGGGGGKMYRWLTKNNYPKGFQVLCHNCNQAKGAYGKCPHQTI